MTYVNASTGETIETARTYAQYLAGYIRDPSTIRARTIDSFGHAPSREEIEAMRAKIEDLRAIPHNSYQLSKYDGTRHDFVEPAPAPPPAPIPFVPRNRPAPITPDEIIRQIAEELGLSYREIISTGRARRITRVRFLIAGLMVERGNTAGHVGMMLGGRDRSTIESACNTLRGLLERDAELMSTYTKYCALWGLSGRFAR